MKAIKFLKNGVWEVEILRNHNLFNFVLYSNLCWKSIVFSYPGVERGLLTVPLLPDLNSFLGSKVF